jgi:hypothetical protein
MKNHTGKNTGKFRQKSQLLWRLPGFIGFVFIVLVSFPLSSAAQNTDDERWLGNYSFEETARLPKKRGSTDVAPFVSFDVTVEMTDGKLKAVFSVNGTQIFEAYECSAKPANDKLEFYYERFVAEGAEDPRKFKKGELLFTLIETRGNKQKQYLFKPAAYKITRLNKSAQSHRIYFNKQ